MGSVLKIYAEHLPHINCINVIVDIPSRQCTKPCASLSDDRLHLSLRFDNQEEAVLQLPVPASQNQPTQLKAPSLSPKDELVYRLNAEAQGSVWESISFAAHTPWSAPFLKQSECIHCSNCRSNILRPSTVHSWKDLPSENWAEMMEFWHCHKPHFDNPDQDTASKGYSASSRLTAQPAVGLVDSHTFLLSPSDCNSLTVDTASHNESRSSSLKCIRCAATIGFVDDKCSGWRLLKSSLAVGIHPYSVLLQKFALEKWIAAFLLSSAEAQTLKKFNLHDTDKQESIALWIFTPDLCISYIDPEGTSTNSIRAMKLFWRIQPWSIAEDTVPPDQSLDRLDLPMPQYYYALKACLEQNQLILPRSARSYQGWSVSILQRFNISDITGTESGAAQRSPNP